MPEEFKGHKCERTGRTCIILGETGCNPECAKDVVNMNDPAKPQLSGEALAEYLKNA